MPLQQKDFKIRSFKHSKTQKKNWMQTRQQTKMTGKWELIHSKNSQQFSLKRFKPTGLLYKGFLFVYGGLSMEQWNPKAIYRYDFIKNQWNQLIAVTSGATQLTFHYGHSAVIYDKSMFVFGGVNIFGKCCNQFYALNMDSLHWKKVEVKGDFTTPSERHSADMMIYKNYILLYGGRNQKEILNDFWFYKLDTKIWCEADLEHYQHFLHVRYRPGICVNEDYIYIYGGQAVRSIQTSEKANQQSNTQFLDDFYRIQAYFRSTTINPEIKHLKIVSPQNPGKRSGHALINLSNKQYLVLVGGENFVKDQQKALNMKNKFWVYDTLNFFWVCLQTEGYSFSTRMLFNIFEYENQVLIFGGINEKKEIIDEICRLTVQYKPVENYIMKQPLHQICQTCIDAQNRLPMQAQIPIDLIENAINKLQFPFSAFGLLIDCAMMQNPSDLKITVSNSHREKYIILKYHPERSKMLFDNSKDFINAMTMWQGVTYDYDEPIIKVQAPYKNQKEQKRHKRMLKSNENEQLKKKRKIFGWNFKVAGLRLGKSVCIMQKDQRQIRVAYLKKGKNAKDQDAYVCYYYNLQQSKYLQTQSSSVRTLIDDNNKLAVKEFKEMAKNSTGTVILIQDWAQIQNCKGQKTDQLIQDYVRNDIIYGDKQKIERLAERGMLVYESIDVSLKSYLSSLLIKSQFVILFGVRQSKLQRINFQSTIQKIDKNVRNKNILDVGEAVDVQSNIIDVYFDPNLTRKPNMFNNGVLIYHQDRLIGRYKYPLGSMLQQMQSLYQKVQMQGQRKRENQTEGLNTESIKNKEAYQYQSNQQKKKLKNFCKLFGIIELPDSYPVNNLKNGFIMDHYLQLLFARIKLVDKIMQKKALQGQLPLSDAARRNTKTSNGHNNPFKRVKPN